MDDIVESRSLRPDCDMGSDFPADWYDLMHTCIYYCTSTCKASDVIHMCQVYTVHHSYIMYC